MPTIKQLTAAAKALDIIRARGTYNGAAYWKRKGGNRIITRDNLMLILGY